MSVWEYLLHLAHGRKEVPISVFFFSCQAVFVTDSMKCWEAESESPSFNFGTVFVLKQRMLFSVMGWQGCINENRSVWQRSS